MRLFLFICCCLPAFVSAQSTGINGNIMSTGRADAGTKIYVIKYNDASKGLYDTINNFITAKLYRRLYADSLDAYTANKKLADGYEGKKRFRDEYEAAKAMSDKEKIILDDYRQKVEGSGAVTKEQFDLLDKHTATALSQAKYFPGNSTATADNSGNYSIQLPPGDYFVLIISNARAGISVAELNGKFFVQHFSLGDNEAKKISTEFHGN